MPPQDSTAADQRQVAAAPADGATGSDKTEQAASVSPHLKIFGDDTEASEFQLRKRTTTVGRSRQCDISLSSQSVSRHHAVISRADGQFTIEDCGSTSGTSVNGRTIEKQVLKHGDNIQIGCCLLQFRTKHAPEGTDEAVAKAESLLRAGSASCPPTCGSASALSRSRGCRTSMAARPCRSGTEGCSSRSPSRRATIPTWNWR